MYVVAGVTGHIGSVAAEALLARGTQVRVIVRSEAQSEAWRARRAKVVVGRLEDTGFLASALRGATGAFLLLPPNATAPDLGAWQRSLVDSIASACARSTLGHAVVLSSLGAQHGAGTGPIAALHQLERRVREAAAQVTILRPAAFMENLVPSLAAARAHGVLPQFVDGDAPSPLIATRDVGAFVADKLVDPPDASTVYELAGPEYRPSQIAALVSKLLMTPVRPSFVATAEQVGALVSAGLSPSVAEAMAEMYRAVESGKLRFEGGTCQPVRCRTSLEEVLPALLAATR